MYLSREEFFNLRIQRVKETASLYDMLIEHGGEVRFKDRSGQMPCVFKSSHSKGKDRRPSARYYPAGERDDYETYYCWVCTSHPLDVIGLLQRIKGGTFMEALRELERKNGIRYDDIEVAQDVGQELAKLARATRTADPKQMLKYAERMLKDNKEALGLKKFTFMCYFLDLIYHKHDDNNPALTISRLDKWQTKLHSLVPVVSDGLEAVE